MKIKLTRNTTIKVFRIMLFLSVVTIIVQFFPHQKKFKYQYEQGKPWTYGLLTATSDFPIYKTDDQLKKDKEELLKNFTPYFRIDENTGKKLINKWYIDWKEVNNGAEPMFAYYINDKLKKIYNKGVLSYQDYEKLKEKDYSAFMAILPDRTTKNISIEDVYTLKTAYEEVSINKPNDFSEDEFRKYNLNLYLVENLSYDSITSQNVQNDILKGLSLTSGMVQAGERIIDKGEIVTPTVYSILNSMKIQSEKKNTKFGDSYIVLFGEIMVVFGLILLLTLYLFLFRPLIFNSNNNLIFISILILMLISLSSIVLRFSNLSVYVIPFTLLPVIIRVFFDSRTALFAHIITVLIASFMVDNPYTFVVLQVAAGMAAVSGLKDLTQRSQLTQTAFYIFLTYLLMYLAVEFVSVGDLTKIHYLPLIYFVISSLLLLFAYVLIYLFEKIFGLISSITLVELTNINSDLMLQFAELAPGTFQHSLQISNLATEAAKKINANSLLVRTGALYHDIGKIKNPQYFIENQSDGDNPLLKMDYLQAAQAVIQHVPDGVSIAKKHHLPEQIIAFITTHHGRGKVKYFYNSFVNEHPNIPPDEEKFTYPGPLPFSKETAILMMADGVEARSRTLEVYTEESISKMVDEMIDSQIADGQFKHCSN
ncbi:MAG: HDIG domain-containing protein [Paludibacteraceae bacterium]